MGEELLSCPFCGRDNVIVKVDENDWEESFYVWCMQCDVFTDSGTHEEVAKHWNTRTP